MSAVRAPAASFGVLGEVRVLVCGDEVRELGGPQPRALLAALVVAGGRVVQAESLVDAVWDAEPPASAAGTLHSYVSRLRRALGPAVEVLERRGQGYRLAVPPEALDWRCFEDLAERGRCALQDGDAGTARALLTEAEQLWRGPALEGLSDRAFAAGLVARLDERRACAHGDRLEAELRLGRHAAVLGELEQAVRSRPLDEARWGRLALARYRSGQQAAALEALAQARRTLADELGVDPGQRLRDLELQVLRQDPALDLPTVERRRSTDVRVPGQRPPGTARARDLLVGRDAELAALLSALDDSATAARFGVVEGEPGIGKTRLLDEVGAVASAQGALVVWGRSHESGAAPAFWPWLPVLRALRDADPEQAESGLTALLDASGGDVTTTGLFTVMDAVTAALRRTAAERRVVVLLDDLQWADAASLELVGFLATHLVDERVLLLATVRELDVGRRDELVAVLAAVARRRGSRRLRLAGLDVQATAALVRQTTDRDVDEAVVRVIHARAEGNPFFATELTRLLDGADPDGAGDLAATAVPAGVSDVVRQRLAALPAATVELLQLCAVMGRVVDLGLLPLATGRAAADCLVDLEPAVVQRLLTEVPGGPGVLHFAHALVREVVVEDLPSVRRLPLHLQVADALAQRGEDDDAELLAEHLWAAVPLGVGERAAAALEAAAEVAVRRFALVSAADLLVRAAELRRAAGGTREHALAELHAVVRLTSVRRAMQGFGGVADLLERGDRLARQVGREDVERELLWATWAMADTACDFPRAEPIALRFRAWAETTDDPALRQFGLHVWGIQCWHGGRLLEARDALDGAHEARQAVVPTVAPAVRDSTLLSFEGERHLLATAFRLAVHELLEDLPGAADELDRLAQGLDPFAVAMVATFGCHAPAARGDHARVEQSAAPVVEADHDGTMSFWGGQARMHLGWAAMCRGELDDGLALWEQGRKVFAGAGLHTGTGLFLANASLALLHAGRLEPAADLAGQAREELEAFRELWPEPVVLLAEAELAGARGDDPARLLDAAARSAAAMGARGVSRRIEDARTRP